MFSAFFRLGRALLALAGNGQRLPAPARKGVEKVRKVTRHLDNERVKRLTEIAAETAEKVAEEVDRTDRNPSASTSFP